MQTNNYLILIGTQTETLGNVTHKEQHSIAIQCDLLGAPPLQLLKPGVSLDDLFTTAETEPEDVDLDTSFCCSQEESTNLRLLWDH